MAKPAPLDLASIRRAQRLVVSIEGMWCAGCAMAVERIIARTPGVTFASTSFTGGSALVRWEREDFDPREIFERVAKLGYRVAPLIEVDEMEQRIDEHARKVWVRLAVALFFGMWSMLGSIMLYVDPVIAGSAAGGWIALGAVVAALPVLTYSAWSFYHAGWRTLRAGVPGMDALISFGVLAATGLSVWQLSRGSTDIYIDTATMLVTFLLCGRLIELHARRRNSAAVSALRQAVPETARRLQADGSSEEVRAADLNPGDRVLIRAGERIAVDGVVLDGESEIDRALVTGQSRPLPIVPGATVEAGSINLSCQLTVRVNVAYGGRLIDRIGVRMLELSGAKSTVALQAERFARWVLPTALLLAIAAFAYGYGTTGDVSDAALRALSVLVAACPCAVGLALPLAYATATGTAARQGIMFRDPASLEALAGAREFLFDKTGTLTSGELQVVDIVSDRASRQRILQLAAQAETGIAHPIADAISHAAEDENAAVAANTQHEEAGHTHRHARGSVWQDANGAHTIMIGAPNWLREQGVGIPAESRASLLGTTRVDLAHNGSWLGPILLRDTLRPEARRAIETLRDAGLTLALATGDQLDAATAFASAVGLDPERVHAGCLPEDKVVHLGKAGKPVVFVGDGVNDALALAADCGVAVQGASAPAVATAGVVIASGGVSGVICAWRLSRRTLGIVRQNLAFSIVYNVAILTFAATGTIPPTAAALAMLASSLSVVANSARLSRPLRDASFSS
ncbi:heavy metal translocating P-type ATPase [Marinobacter changyiensis]|uniref:heavy metal translocating P-type ATPase n=1 Tax=Marinobacter changyiensis TaxID=2604091 RepID=UPI001264C009|nr:cation-translocating P-type ATPase [Marinobacter changyiensis]